MSLRKKRFRGGRRADQRCAMQLLDLRAERISPLAHRARATPHADSMGTSLELHLGHRQGAPLLLPGMRGGAAAGAAPQTEAGNDNVAVPSAAARPKQTQGSRG